MPPPNFDPSAGQDSCANLIRKARTKDKAAWDQLCPLVQPTLLALAQRSRPGHAEDLVQKTWMRAWACIHQFNGGATDRDLIATFYGWIRTILARTILNDRRGPPPPGSPPPLGDGSSAEWAGPPDRGPTASQEAVAREEAERLQRALANLETILAPLPPKRRDRMRQVMTHYLDGKSFREIARVLGCDPTTVGDDMHLIEDFLKRELRGRSYEHAQR